jgi:hypothetical protein
MLKIEVELNAFYFKLLFRVCKYVGAFFFYEYLALEIYLNKEEY